MSVGFAAGLVNGWLDAAFASPYAQLHTGDPGVAGTANISAGDNSRKVVTMSASNSGLKVSSATAGPWVNASTNENISYLSLWSAVTGGTLLGIAQIPVPQNWAATNSITLTNLQISVTPIIS